MVESELNKVLTRRPPLKWNCLVNLNVLTCVIVIKLNPCPQTDFALAVLSTDSASCAPWLISPLFRSPSSLHSSQTTRLFNCSPTSSGGVKHGSNLEDLMTWLKNKNTFRKLYIWDSLFSPLKTVRAYVYMCVRKYANVRTKTSRKDRLPVFLTHSAPL